jgi:hypothetical protein
MGGQIILNFLPCRPNFDSLIFVNQTNLMAEIVGDAIQLWWNTDPVFRVPQGASCEAQYRTGCERAPPTIARVR